MLQSIVSQTVGHNWANEQKPLKRLTISSVKNSLKLNLPNVFSFNVDTDSILQSIQSAKSRPVLPNMVNLYHTLLRT